MTIDERLEKLVERHEALSQTVELLVHLEKDRQERERVREERQREHDEKNQVLMAQMMESIDSLARIARA